MTRTAARSSGASAAAGWPTFSGASDPPRQGTCPRFARHAAPGSRGPSRSPGRDGDDDGSGRQHSRGGGLYSKAQRDRAAQRGNNAARNHVLRVAHHNMRQSRNQSPRPSVDRLDMGWGALETLASQPLARAREEGSRSPRGAVTLPRMGGTGVGCACAGGACGVRARAGRCVRLHHVRR